MKLLLNESFIIIYIGSNFFLFSTYLSFQLRREVNVVYRHMTEQIVTVRHRLEPEYSIVMQINAPVPGLTTHTKKLREQTCQLSRFQRESPAFVYACCCLLKQLFLQLDSSKWHQILLLLIIISLKKFKKICFRFYLKSTASFWQQNLLLFTRCALKYMFLPNHALYNGVTPGVWIPHLGQ